jgi:hypothetical protein
MLQRPILEHQRNDTLFGYASHLKDRREISPEMALMTLTGWNVLLGQPPLPQAEVEKCWRQAYKYPLRRTRTPGPCATALRIYFWLWNRCWIPDGILSQRYTYKEIQKDIPVEKSVIAKHIRTLEKYEMLVVEWENGNNDGNLYHPIAQHPGVKYPDTRATPPYSLHSFSSSSPDSSSLLVVHAALPTPESQKTDNVILFPQNTHDSRNDVAQVRGAE